LNSAMHVLSLVLAFSFALTIYSSCPCTDQKLCNPITTPTRPELFVFGGPSYEKYDWTYITTFVWWSGKWDPNITCFAHSKGARVILPVGLDLTTAQVQDPKIVETFVQNAVALVQSRYADGVNFDFEDLIYENDTNGRRALSAAAKKLNDAIHMAVPGSQVSFDAGWAPNIDLRFYDYLEISKNSDLFFVMDYDEQSQIEGPCRAGATSHYLYLATGMGAYQNLGIQTSQLVMGLPWYGHDFPCLDPTNETVCPLELAPWRGAQCTDLYAPEYPYSELLKSFLPKSTTGRMWDSVAQSPWFNYVDGKGVRHQIWYDDSDSISDKVLWAKVQGKLRGVGMYTAEFLDYSDDKQVKDFWKATNAFFGK